MARFWIEAVTCTNLPAPSCSCPWLAIFCCRRRCSREEVLVRIMELDTPRAAGEVLPQPAMWWVNGALHEDGQADFLRGQPQPVEVDFDLPGRKLRLEVIRGSSRSANAPAIGFAEIAYSDLRRNTDWCLLLGVPHEGPISKSGLGDPEGPVYKSQKPQEDGTMRRPAFLHLRVRRAPDREEEAQLRGLPLEERVGVRVVDSPARPSAGRHIPGSGVVRPRVGGKKRVMIMTRGTRGDVQPFLALAWGLAQVPFECEVTIVTELAFKKFIKDFASGLQEKKFHGGDHGMDIRDGVVQSATGQAMAAGVVQGWRVLQIDGVDYTPDLLEAKSAGSAAYLVRFRERDPLPIRFRPCGGDTKKQTDANRKMLALGAYSDILQSLFLAKSEQNFFSSEGCFMYWAEEERPDFIVFGFTVTHIAMIVSEALQIPIVAFFLQPVHEVERRPHPTSVLQQLSGPLRAMFNRRDFNAILAHLLESSPDRPHLNYLRTTRNLAPRPRIHNDFLQFEELSLARVTQITPISPAVLTEEIVGKMTDDGLQLTDFIFLGSGQEALHPDMQDFVQSCKADKRQIVLITFSSMPVGEKLILRMACDICRLNSGPAVIAMVGGQDCFSRGSDERLWEEAESLQSDHNGRRRRLLVWRTPASFGVLFPLMDAVVLHGGLGVTSEALVAGLPVVVSGILLLDQRYWAKRVSEIGSGPDTYYNMTEVLKRAPSGLSYIAEFVQQALDKKGPLARSAVETKKRIEDARAGRQLERVEGGNLALTEERAREADGIMLNAYYVYHGHQVISDAYGRFAGRGHLYRERILCFLTCAAFCARLAILLTYCLPLTALVLCCRFMAAACFRLFCCACCCSHRAREWDGGRASAPASRRDSVAAAAAAAAPAAAADGAERPLRGERD